MYILMMIVETLIIATKLGIQEKCKISCEFTVQQCFNVSRQPQIIKMSLMITFGPYQYMKMTFKKKKKNLLISGHTNGSDSKNKKNMKVN